jgi:hypothetical protein
MSWGRASAFTNVTGSWKLKVWRTCGSTPEARMVMVGGPSGVGEGSGAPDGSPPEDPQAAASSATVKARRREGIDAARTRW